jgi:peroxiredoxin
MLVRCSVVLVTAVLMCAARAEAGKFNKALKVGEPAPTWVNLPGIDGKEHSLKDYDARLLVVIFTCNSCPVAAGYQDRINRLAAEHDDETLAWVAINANPGQNETLDKMSALAKEKKLACDYLKDADQQTAKAYGARTTPTVFLLNEKRQVLYMGAIDDNWESEDEIEHAWLRDAITAALAGKRPEVAESRATGCGIPFGTGR